MSEWSYVMLVEAVVFLLCALGTIQLQNSVVPSAGGISTNARPVIASAAIIILFASALCLGVALILSLNIDFDNSPLPSFESLFCIGLVRGVRGAIGVVLLSGVGYALLLYTSSDWESWLSLFNGNQLITSSASWKYRLFAIIITGLLFSASICLILCIHKLLYRLNKATNKTTSSFTPSKTPRVTWTIAMTFVVLIEIQFFMHYNTVHAYNKRPVFISISSIMAASSVFIVDITIVKIYDLRGHHVTWFRILACTLYLGTLCGFGILVVIHAELHTEDTMTTNICLLALLLIGIVMDLTHFLHLPSKQATSLGGGMVVRPPDTQNTPTTSITPITSIAPPLPYTATHKSNISSPKGLLDELITTGSRAHSAAHSTLFSRDSLRPRTLKLKHKIQ